VDQARPRRPVPGPACARPPGSRRRRPGRGRPGPPAPAAPGPDHLAAADGRRAGRQRHPLSTVRHRRADRQLQPRRCPERDHTAVDARDRAGSPHRTPADAPASGRPPGRVRGRPGHPRPLERPQPRGHRRRVGLPGCGGQLRAELCLHGPPARRPRPVAPGAVSSPAHRGHRTAGARHTARWPATGPAHPHCPGCLPSASLACWEPAPPMS
jgi:hypothetical protein